MENHKNGAGTVTGPRFKIEKPGSQKPATVNR